MLYYPFKNMDGRGQLQNYIVVVLAKNELDTKAIVMYCYVSTLYPKDAFERYNKSHHYA